MKVGRLTRRVAVLVSALALGSLISASLGHAEEPNGKKGAASPSVASSYDVDALRLQGEQRFRANCGRCHAAPRKFPPRMMATIVRHMRVRATITDEDMRLVLFYMSQ